MEYFKRDMREGDKGETRLVGADVPTDTFHYLNLFCLVDSRSKTSIIRPLIEKWAAKAQKKFSEKKLIELAANNGYKGWKNRSNRRTPFANVLKIQQRELQRKGVSDKHIAEIIKQIEYAKDKEN